MMETVFLRILAASVLCTRSEGLFHIVYEPKNMADALQYCREKYTDLASVVNTEDVKIMNETASVSNKVHTFVWIGLHYNINRWTWSLPDERFYKDGETEFRKWGPFEPSNTNNIEDCTQMSDTGLWSDVPCLKENFATLCFDAKGPEKFVLILNYMTWYAAQSLCRGSHTDLASVRNEAENQQIKEMVPKGQKLWIGLYRETWKWSDGSEFSFSYWREGEPDNLHMGETCVLADLSSSSKWVDNRCSSTNAFVCELKIIKQVIKVRWETKDSSLNLNAPHLMDALLKQLKQMLKDTEATKSIKLSWVKQLDGKVFHEQEKRTKK